MNASQSKSAPKIEVIVRGVCVLDNQVLLCRNVNSNLFYLPGGHIEFRETAIQALKREIHEELGVEAVVGAFLGCCEHAFLQKGEAHAEINLVFEMRIPAYHSAMIVSTAEAWLAFEWCALSRMQEVLLEPAPLRELLPEWLKNPGGHFVSGDAWCVQA